MPLYRYCIAVFLLIALLAGASLPAAAQGTSSQAGRQTARSDNLELFTGQTFKGLPYTDQRLAGVNFKDTRGHWSFTPVLRLASQGLVSGRGPGRFAPEEQLTREEALSLLLRVAGLETATASPPGWQQNPPFGQENPTAALAAAYGLLGGREMALAPEEWQQPAPRQEVAAWVGRTLGLAPAAGGLYPNLAGFTDGQRVDRELAPWVEAVLQQGYLAGVKAGVFGPDLAMKRGEMAALLERVDNQLASRRGVSRVEGQVVDRVETQLPDGRLAITLRVAAFAGPVINLEISATAAGAPLVDFILSRDGSLTSGQNLAVGDPVRLILQGENVLLAEASGSRRELTGMILVVADGDLILADQQGRQYRYPAGSLVTAGAYPGGTPVPGQEVNLTVQNGVITRLVPLTAPVTPAYGQLPAGALNGYLRQVGSDRITVVTAAGQERTVKVSGVTAVSRAGRYLNLSDLLVGDQVKVRLDPAGQAQEIQVSSGGSLIAGLLKGQLEQFNYQDGRVVLRDAREFFYGRWLPAAPLQAVNLTREAAASLNGGLGSSPSGGEVVIALASGPQGRVGVQAARLNGAARIFEGYLDELSLGAGEMLLRNRRQALDFTPATMVIKNGQPVEAADLERGDYLFTLATADGGGRAAAVVTEALFPASWRAYRGKIDAVTREGFELRKTEELNSGGFRQYDWREPGDDELELELGWDVLINDRGQSLSREEFTESRFTDEYVGYSAYTLVKGEVARGLLLLPRSTAAGPTLTSLGRVKEVNRADGRLTVEAVRDWSSGYDEWRDNSLPLTLNAGTALVLKDRDVADIDAVLPGDKVYLVHDRQQAMVLMVND